MKIGRKIGEGGNSEVFEWGHHKVIKLAKPNTGIIALQREYNNNLAVWKMGLSVPQPFEIVTVNHQPGIVFERVDGESTKERLFKTFMGGSNVNNQGIDWEDVRMTARFLSELHQLSNDEIQPQRAFLKSQIRSANHLNKDEKENVIGILDHLPVKNKICHGDPNPNNILVRNGESVFIDWNDATVGNPESDVAEYILMIKYAILPPETPQMIIRAFDEIRETIVQVFMEEYTLLTGITYDEVEPWFVPIATRKLTADAISDEEKKLLVKEIRQGL